MNVEVRTSEPCKDQKGIVHMNKDRFDEILTALKTRDENHHRNKVLWVLAVIGTIAAVVGIAYAIYRFFAPDYLDDFEDDFDEDFEDYFEDEDEDEYEEDETDPAADPAQEIPGSDVSGMGENA